MKSTLCMSFFLSLNFCFAETTDQPRLNLNDMVPGEIRNVAFENGTILTENLYAIKFEPLLRTTLLSFIEKNGVLEKFHELKNNPLEEEASSNTELEDGLWQVRRPPSFWNFNMHWISPAEEETQLTFLEALGDGGLDDAIHAIGTKLGLDGLSAFHLTFIAVTQCSEGYIHCDFEETGQRGYNLIIPLLLVEDSLPELDVQVDATMETVGLKYEYDTGILQGDEAYHATAAIDYTGTGLIRVMATVFLADINEDNVEGVLAAYSQDYPPADVDWLLAHAGEHWPNPQQLPRSNEEEVFEEGSLEKGEEGINSEL